MHCCVGFSLVAESEACSLFAVRGLFIAKSSHSRVNRPQQLRHEDSVVAVLRLQSTGSVAVTLWLSCSVACGIFPSQGSNPCLLHWQMATLLLSHQGSPRFTFNRHSLSKIRKVKPQPAQSFSTKWTLVCIIWFTSDDPRYFLDHS